MGVLKILINIADYLLTAVACILLTDVLYQLAFHLMHFKFLEELSWSESLWNFKPDISKFVSIISISKKALSWAITKWIG